MHQLRAPSLSWTFLGSFLRPRGRAWSLAVWLGLGGIFGLGGFFVSLPSALASPSLRPVFSEGQGSEGQGWKANSWGGGGGGLAFEGGACERGGCQTEARPPLEWPLILLQIFGGLITAAVSSYLIQTLMEVTIIGTQSTPEKFQTAWVAYTVTNTVAIPWITAGVVYGLSRLSHNYETSFWWILLGAYCGQALSTIIGTIITAADPTAERRVARIVSLLMDGALNALGAILFFVLFRRAYKEVQHAGSLLYYEGGRVHFTLPVPSVAWEAQGTLISVPLLRGHF